MKLLMILKLSNIVKSSFASSYRASAGLVAQ